MPSCYAVGAKKALIYRAYRTQNRGSKEKIPYPSKSAFYCATNLKQRSDEAMAVFRVERNTGYTVMSNHHLRNKELSLKAKGLLSQMLSLPEDWDYTLAGLSYINRESIDAILKYRYWVRKINCPVFCLIPFVYFKSKRFIIGVK